VNNRHPESWQAFVLAVSSFALLLLAGVVCLSLMPERISALTAEIIAFAIPGAIFVRVTRLGWRSVLLVSDPPGVALIGLLPPLGAVYAVSTSKIVEFTHEMYPIPKELIESLASLMRADSPAEFVIVVAVVAAAPAVLEELVFRGLIQRTLVNRMDPARGIVFTACIFALFHLNPWAMIPLFISGVLYGVVSYRTGTFWAGSLAHFGNNLACVVAINSVDEISYDSLTRSASLYIFVPCVIFAVAGTVALFKLTGGRREVNPDFGSTDRTDQVL
jgi:membrane protease YdiL (CAAX protease family)